MQIEKKIRELKLAFLNQKWGYGGTFILKIFKSGFTYPSNTTGHVLLQVKNKCKVWAHQIQRESLENGHLLDVHMQPDVPIR